MIALIRKQKGTTPPEARSGDDANWDASGEDTQPCESLLVVVPAFNEEESIGQVVEDVQSCGDRLAKLGVDLCVCVIDDGSTDDTAGAAQRAGADHILVHKQNQGLVGVTPFQWTVYGCHLQP